MIVDNKKRIIVLITTIAISSISSGIFINAAQAMDLKMLAIMKCLIYAFDFLIAWIAMKINGIRLDIDIRNVRQYIVGIAMGLVLLVVMTVLGVMSGMSTGGVTSGRNLG